MPSRRSPKPTPAGDRNGWLVLLLLLFVGAGLAGCGTGRAPRPEGPPAIPDRLAPFLVPPVRGYPLTLSADVSAELERGYREGVRSGRPALARSVATSLLDRDRDLAPAFVLLAQAAALEDRYPEAVDWAARAAESHPGYTAAQLVLARANEELGEISRAYAIYNEASDASSAARERARLLGPRVEEILGNRIRDALERHRLAEASRTLEELRLLAPESVRTKELAVEVYREAERPREELRALRALQEERPREPELRQRLAELELEIGDPATALKILEELQAELPERQELEELTERAKFRWRLRNLPDEVQGILQEPRLSRADYAVLLYWLVPTVRSAGPVEGRIATDILDHPQRRWIARVVNLGLMNLTSGVREFEPERSVRRVEALNSLLEILSGKRPAPACVVDWRRSRRPSTAATCETAAACGLLSESSECLPGAEVSSRRALEWIRRLSAF